MASKKVAVKPAPEIYSMSKQVNFWMWLFFTLALIPFPYSAYITFEDGNYWNAALFIIVAMTFLSWARTFEKLRHVKIELSSTGITRVEVDGTRILLKWGEIAHLDGVLLSNKDRTQVLRLDMVKDCGSLLEKVFEKVRKRMEAPRLPMAFSKAFRSVLVEEKGITCRGFRKSHFLPWDAIERVDWSYFYFPWAASRHLFIKLVLKTGRTIRVRPSFSDSGEMYLVLKKSFGKFGHPKHSNKAEEAVAAKKRKREWLRPFAAGALLITFPGLFLGKVVYRMMDGSGFWSVLGLVLVFAAIFLFLCLLFRREARVLPVPAEEVPSKLNTFATSLSFLIAGFFLTGYFWWFTGKIALDHVKAEVVKAGYSLKMPENAPKLPDTKNAVYYIKKAVKVPSAESLFYEDYKDKKPAYDKPFYGKDTQYEFLKNFCKDLRSGKPAPEKVTAMGKLIQEHGETLRLVDIGFTKKGVDLGIDFTVVPPHKIEFPRISPPLTLSKLLASRAYLLAREGKTEEAIKSLQEVLFLAETAGEVKFVIGVMVDVAMARIALDSAREVFPKVDARELKAKLMPLLKDKERKQACINSFQYDFFPYNGWQEASGWLEYAKFLGANQFKLDDENNPAEYLTGFFRWPFLCFEIAAHYKFGMESIAVSSLPFPDREKAYEKAEKDYKCRGWFADGFSPMNVQGLYNRVLEYGAFCNVFRAAVETRIYLWQNKKWPSSVSDLPGGNENYSDPFTNGALLKLKKEGDGVMIYSLGIDGQDDGGKSYVENADHRDISWIVSPPPGAGSAKSVSAKPVADEIPTP